jgi:hypothetical protein
MFISPLILISAVSVLAAGSRWLNRLSEDNPGPVKLLMFGVFLLLGVIIAGEANPVSLSKEINSAPGKDKKAVTGQVNKTAVLEPKDVGIDLGDVPLGKIYKGFIRFPFAIKSISTSCDCLKATADSLHLDKDPNAWVLKVFFDPKGYYGFVEQEIRIVNDAGRLIVVEIKANVIDNKTPAKQPI